MVSRGIDISKSSFVAAYPSTNGNPTKTFPNTTATNAWAHRYACCRWASLRYGSYQQLRLLLYLLHQNGIAVSFAPPQKADQAFFPNDDARNQTERKDATWSPCTGRRWILPSTKCPRRLQYGSLPPKGLPTLTMQSNYPASSEYVQPINNQEHP